jgi:hypothetical protein
MSISKTNLLYNFIVNLGYRLSISDTNRKE